MMPRSRLPIHSGTKVPSHSVPPLRLRSLLRLTQRSASPPQFAQKRRTRALVVTHTKTFSARANWRILKQRRGSMSQKPLDMVDVVIDGLNSSAPKALALKLDAKCQPRLSSPADTP